jgi:hypothetical protein
VGYSVAEVKAWVCCFLLARVSEFRQNEALVFQIVKTYFNPSEGLSLLENKLTGRLVWDYGLEGKYAAEQEFWQQQAQSSEQNAVCLQWLSMAQASWAAGKIRHVN